METYIARGHVQLASPESNAVSRWFLPHHVVLHQHKPEKLRVVFDCAARFGGTSLNGQLSKRPDFLNSLIGVLTRFRTEKVAVIGDFEQIFYEVFVDPKDRRYLRFLWWPQGSLLVDPQIYHMNVHLFGATSSPCCARFVLLESVNDQSSQFDFEALRIVQKNFYMNNCIFSVPTAQDASYLIGQVTRLLQNRGFNLTKWLANDSITLESIPTTKLSRTGVSLTDKSSDLQVCERVLGLLWNCTDDSFHFSLQLKEKPLIRRGILSVLS